MTSINIKNKAMELGFLGCGIIPSKTFHEYIKYLDERVKSFPQSKNLYGPLYANAVPPENVKSIIVCTRTYSMYKIPESLKNRFAKFYLFDSRIPYTREYRAKTEFEEYIKLQGINILPCRIPDRWAAAKAGLGKFGRNNFIYSEHGSYIWIDTWGTDSELEYEGIQEDIYLPACNDNCQKCVNSCPTKALSGSFSMNRGICITALVCSAKEPVDDEKKRQSGLWQYGCDACQDACPANRGKMTESEEFPLLAEMEEYLKPENVLEMDEQTYQNIVNPRFWYSGKDGIWLWKCNALRAMINSGDEKYYSLIKKCLGHEDERIRETAAWGCKTLGI